MRPIESLEGVPLELELSSPVRSLTRCGVCGFAEVQSDEVVDRGRLLLGECPRCEHRWTRSPALPVALPVVVAAPARRAHPPHGAPEELIAAEEAAAAA